MEQSETLNAGSLDPVVMPRRETLTNFPGMKAYVEMSGQYFLWVASYDDGSGSAQGWSPTKRGAKLQAINQCRRKSGNYSKVIFKWHNE